VTDLRWDGAFFAQFFLCLALGRPAGCAVGAEKKPHHSNEIHSHLQCRHVLLPASPRSKRRPRMTGLAILGGSLVLVAVSLGWVLRR
jgi:hypothetical protein